MIDINHRFNVHSTISYLNVRHIKCNIYEAETKENYFRLVSLKTVHPIDRDFSSYDIAEILVDYHSYIEYVQRVIVF